MYFWEFVNVLFKTIVAIIVNLYYEQIILKINIIVGLLIIFA